MALETVTHISDLVVTNPTSTDPKSEGDNHLRNIKTALKTDFPNISGVVTKTHTQLNNTVDKTGDTMTGNLTVPSINGGQLAGLRNKIINGNFGINQRAYVSGAATTASQYTLDRWKVTGTGGITFSTTANKTTVTIPSGQTLQQVVEGLNLESGTYVLSWEGTAQGRIAGGSYGASGAVTASITGGTNTTIEFNTGTVARVILEVGSVATPFEHRPYGMELALCQRYYYRIQPGGNQLVLANSYFSISATAGRAVGKFPVNMRGTVSLEQSGTAGNYAVTDGAGALVACSAVPTLNILTTGTDWAISTTVAAGLTAGQGGFFLTSSASGASAYLGFSAEL